MNEQIKKAILEVANATGKTQAERRAYAQGYINALADVGSITSSEWDDLSELIRALYK